MSLSKLVLSHYRNFEVQEWVPSLGVNLVVGRNAQGKTNLLEAVGLLSTGRILRSVKDDSAAIRIDSDVAEVRGEVANSGTELKVVLRRGQRRRGYLNGVGLARTSDLLGRLPTVVFSQSDMAIVRGDASERRRFLDLELSQMYPVYLRHLTAYKRALEQRNALLKQAQTMQIESESFEIWEAQLAEHGLALREYRIRFIDELGRRSQQVHAGLSRGEVLRLAYEVVDEISLVDSLSQGRARDIHRGSTQTGPHRDDCAIFVNEKMMRIYGSQGQQRTAVLSLKLATIELVEQALGRPPIILLDDVLSELDIVRREQLLEVVLQTKTQTVLTCTEADQAGDSIQKNASIFAVQAGNVTPL